MSLEKKINKYANLIVKSGLNVQKGQTVIISGSIESYQLIREVTKEAYLVGAKEVVVSYSDDVITRMKYENVDHQHFTKVPEWFATFKNNYAKENAAFLYIDDSDPEMLNGVDPKKISAWTKAVHEACQPYYELSDNMTNSWCIVGASTKKWANKVYPDMSDEEAIVALWQAIFKSVNLDEQDDVNVAWQQHRKHFEKRVKILNEMNLKSLHYKNKLGTDFTVGLPKHYLFAGGGSYLKNGLYTFPNMPTEEIFCSPDKDYAEGIVYSSLPLSYNGHLVEDFYLRFLDGRVVDFGAKKGYDILKEIINGDEGSHHLGECALIPYDSPINNMKTLFYSTLFDENASCHLAIGKGFSECLQDGSSMSKEELLKHGINDSANHVDFMIGTEDLDITGTTVEGKEIKIFEKGEFTF